MLAALENPVHILLVLLILVLLYGVKRLPELGRSLGSGLFEFRSGLLDRGREAPQDESNASSLRASEDPNV